MQVRQLSRIQEHKKKVFFEHLRSRSDQTYDVHDLKTKYGNIIPVFIYDGLMKGHADEVHMKDAMYFGPCTTLSDDYVLMKHKDNILLYPEGEKIKNDLQVSKMDFKRVQGDLYGVPLDFIYQLDKVYNNGFSYERCDISVTLHRKGGGGALVRDVQVYFASCPYWMREPKPLIKQVPAPIITSKYRYERIYRGFHNEFVDVSTPRNETPIWGSYRGSEYFLSEEEEANWNGVG